MVKKSIMKLKPPTMHDVAKLAGVSQPTVSRVLNQSETTVPISDQTRQRVLAAVEKLGYRPNVVARSLRTQRTQTVAMMIADITNSYYHPMARAVQDVARQHDYEVLISNSDHIYENEKHFCDIVLSRGVDGVIMVPIHLTTGEMDRMVSKTHIPFVVLGQHIDHPNIDVVYVADDRAIYETTCWLISDCGHKTLGYIGVPDYLPPGPRRFGGFKQALNEFGLKLDPRFLQIGDFTLEGGRRAAHALIQTGELPTALLVVNDLMAIGVILALQEAGYSVPDDVAVVGFDDIPEAIIVRPTLTTIAQDPRDIGLKLATALFERIENPNIVGRRVFESSYKLMQRQSTQVLVKDRV
jgi:DNA-binding LacI/PurR family transcriptional regulator